MAFEHFTAQLLALADEARDPGSADAFLRLSVAAEATLKLAGVCLLSEGAYRHSSEPAKTLIGETIAGRNKGWAEILEVSGRLPDCALAKRLMSEPAAGDRVHELWTQMNDLLAKELDVVNKTGVTKRKSLSWRHALKFLPFLRNKVKGHGSPPARLYAQLNPLLREMVQHAIADLVAPIPPALAFVRAMREGQGLFLRLGSPLKEVELPIEIPTLQAGDMVLAAEGGAFPLVPLMTFDERTRAILVFNDSVAEATGELEYIDYLLGPVARRPAHFVTRHGFAELPASETTSTSVLSSTPGVVPHNLPERPRGHVPRPELETTLLRLLLDDKHRLISLDGRGGIGKTYVSREVCRVLSTHPAALERFGFMLWMSARDVDLTVAGPKQVRQDLVTLEDVLRFAVRAYDPAAAVDTLSLAELRARFVETCEVLHPLLILDNFETFADPEDLHHFLDDTVPFQAKVLTTSRHRYFRGDYPLQVGAMSETESRALILEEARVRGVAAHFEAPDRVRRVYETAQGHAYTMRLIVGQVSDRMPVHEACVAVEKSDDVLSALFERSLRLAQPIDAEVAAVLASFRAECPLEALMLVPSIPKSEVEDSVGRLFHLSLLERIDEPLLSHPQYICPRAAGEYIRRKRLLDAPEARNRLDKTVRGLRAWTHAMRQEVKLIRGGVKTRTQAADVMMALARNANEAKDHTLVRRAVAVAEELAGEDARITREAASLSKDAGSDPNEVDAMFERASVLNEGSFSFWMEWGRFKGKEKRPIAGALACFEHALELEPRSREAADEFVSTVLEVLKQEKKLGAAAVRPDDARHPRTLAAKASAVLDEHLKMRQSARDRAHLLGHQGWILLQLGGLTPRLRKVVAEAEELAPDSVHVRGLVHAVKRIEAERKG